MARVDFHAGSLDASFQDWADKEGAARAERIANAQRAAAPVRTGQLRASIRVVRKEHPSRPVFQIGPAVPYAALVEANTGFLARSLGTS